MAQAIITLKIMPVSPETDLESIRDKAINLIKQFAGEGDMKIEEQPVAYGLKSIQIIFVMDESLGSTEDLETKISANEDVASVEVTDVRRAIG